MSQPFSKHSPIQLYVNDQDIYSHQVRLVLAEKGVQPTLIRVSPAALPEALLQINPYGTLPTLVERDSLVLYKTHIIAEYVEDRFPHPSLLPAYPVARARTRQMIYRIERDWYPLLAYTEIGQSNPAAQKLLKESLAPLAPLFSNQSWFLGEDFSLLDCCIAPLLWRLDQLNIKLDELPEAIQNYRNRIFQRSAFLAFRNSLQNEEWML